MRSLLDRPAPTPPTGDAPPAERLRAAMAACRLQFAWLGTQKALTLPQRAAAASAFDAEAHSLSAGKKLLDTQHPAYRAVTAVRTRATDYWRSLTLPFPEPGVRLIRQTRVEEFAARMAGFRAELDEAVGELDRHYGELKAAARRRLGSQYAEADYPDSLVGLFGVSWGFPSVEPPAYLVQLSPALYAQEQRRVRARFEEAVALAERAFAEELARLVEHLAERLSGPGEDGQPKVFRDSAVANLRAFFDRFAELNVRSDPELDALVERARRVVRGIDAADLRGGEALRQRVAAGLGQVRTALDALLVERPRRRVLRQAASPVAGGG